MHKMQASAFLKRPGGGLVTMFPVGTSLQATVGVALVKPSL